MLVPPACFGIAEEGIYRCSKVETLNLSFLETLNLKTVIFIGGQEPSKFFKEFFNRSSIDWFVIRIGDLSSAGKPVDNSKNNKESVGNIGNGSTSVPKNADSTERVILDNGQKELIESKDGLTNLNNIENLRYTLNENDDLMLIKSACLKRTFKKLLNSKNYNTLLVDKTSLIVGILRKLQKWNLSSIINEHRLYSGKNRSYYSETFLELINIRIEQEPETDNSDLKPSNVNMNTSLHFAEETRKLSNIVIVDEDDLCKAPEVPQRLIRIVEEAKMRDQLQFIAENSGVLPASMTRSTSNLGVFGHRYRLAFNKKENGNYDYYKSQNSSEKDAITIKIPKESELPEWFKFQRDLWEQENVPEEHHFYKEHIFI